MGLRDEITTLYHQYLDNSVELIKSKRDKIFALYTPELNYHSNNCFEGDSITKDCRGYIKIVGEKTDGQPLVRIINDDLIIRQNVFFPEQKCLNNRRRRVVARTFTGYSWRRLVGIVGDVVSPSKIPQLFKDLLDEKDNIDCGELTDEQIRNNTKRIIRRW